MKVSIIIATYNHLEDCLKPCCEALQKYVNFDECEVIIAANGCMHDTREYVESLGKNFKLLWFEKPGFALPVNEAARIAQGEYLLFLNNDCFFLKDDVIDLLVAEFEKNPKAGIVGPEFCYNEYADTNYIKFYCTMMRRDVFNKLGMFDTLFADGTCEDVDLCIKAVTAGYELVMVTLPVFHRFGVTVRELKNISSILTRNAFNLGKRYNSRWYQSVQEQIVDRSSVSIVIATYNHLDDCLKPCIESIKKYCNFENKEVIIVANGCKDGTREYVESLGEPFKLLWFDEAVGAAKAYNAGIREAKYDNILLLNNDVFFLEQSVDTLINMHLIHFNDPKVGIVGPIKSFSPPVGREFIIFFCAMIRKSVFDKIGYLDEIFIVGAGEDTDFCIRAEAAGYTLAVAGEMTGHDHKEGQVTGSVPIFHKGEATVHDESLVSGWKEIFERNGKILAERYPKVEIEKDERKEILCVIPTKGRYFTTLPLAIESVILQTVKPDKLTIYDDGEHKDLRQVPTYQYLFNSLDSVGIKWDVAFTPGIGQHHAHQHSNTSDYKYVWRLDDDTVARPDVLEKLLSHMKDDIGAVAGSVITPGQEAKSDFYGTNILDINRFPNIQWARGQGVYEVEHLYSSFLYRSNVVDYCLELSRVAHREETIFTHRLFRAGYRLLVDRSAVTYHYRNPEGGIMAETDKTLWDQDEKIFRSELEKWGYKMIALSHGLGDHLMFVNIIPELLKKCKTLVLFCVYGEVFFGLPNVVCLPLGCAAAFGVIETGVYEYMTKYNWKRSMVKAYEQLYLN